MSASYQTLLLKLEPRISRVLERDKQMNTLVGILGGQIERQREDIRQIKISMDEMLRPGESTADGK